MLSSTTRLKFTFGPVASDRDRFQQSTVARTEEKMNTIQWIRSAQTNYKPNSTFFSFFRWQGSNLSQFQAGASKPGVFNERMCSVMESAGLKPRCDSLPDCSIWPPGLSTHKTSADTSGENEIGQIKATLAQPSSRETSRL